MNPLFKSAEIDWKNIAGQWTPAVYGGAAGLGLGALSTQGRPNESKGSRAMRILRNALLGGALGAGGAQAISHGAGKIQDVVEDPDGTGPPKPTEVGALGYAGGAAALNVHGRMRSGGVRRSELGTLMSPNGFGDPGRKAFGRLNGPPGKGGWDLGKMGEGVSRADYLKAVDARIKGIARGGSNEWAAFRRAFGANFGQGNPGATDDWLKTVYGGGDWKQQTKNFALRNMMPTTSQIIPNTSNHGVSRRLQAGMVGGGLKLPLALGLPHLLARGADAVTGAGAGAEAGAGEAGDPIFKYLTKPVSW
jgi:hypothetical protein